MKPRFALAALVAALAACSADEIAPTTDAGSDGGDGAAEGSVDGGGDAGACPNVGQVSPVADALQKRLSILSDPSSVTIADPSIEYPVGAPGGALAYSSLPAGIGGRPDQGAIRTHVAISNDQGKTWTWVAAANQPTAVTPPPNTCPDAGACTAHIVNETSSIVFDPTDLAARQWKLFTHRYVVVQAAGKSDLILYTEGHIAMFTAPLPSGPWSAPEVAVGWPGSALSQTGAKYLPANDPGTAACGAFGEPGATVAPDGSIHLALSCIQPPFANPTLDVVLLRSLDHGQTFTYVGTPLRGADGVCFGGDGKRVNGVDLFTVGKTEYLMATPEQGASGRAGCVVVPFADVAKAKLARDPNGAILAARYLAPQFDGVEIVHYAGACTHGEGAPATGYTMSHLHAETAMLPELHEIATGVVGP